MKLKIIFYLFVFIFATSPVIAADQPPAVPFVGEQIKYAIKKMGIKAGEATLTFKGTEKINGQDVYLVIFKSTGMNFYDEEKIYLDPKTFYPRQVERDLDIFGKKEKITEQYDSSGKITITKNAGGKKTVQVLERHGVVENIYGFIYRYRQTGQFTSTENIKIILPTMDIVFEPAKADHLKIAGQSRETYFLKSKPAKYKVWFEKNQKTPLRIDGAVGFGDTTMVMISYTKP